MSAGIYTIVNTKTGSIYVGRSTDAEEQITTDQQQLSNHGHQNEKLQSDWDTYGSEVFNFRVIEHVESEGDLPDRYQWWIAKYHDTHGADLVYNPERPSRSLQRAVHQPGTGSKLAASGCVGCGTLLLIAVPVILIFGDGATSIGIGIGVALGLIVFVTSFRAVRNR